MQINIGKNGFNEGIINALKTTFKTRENVKISVLKSAGHTKEKVVEIAEKIVGSLGKNYDYTIVGFILSLRKYRKPRR